MMLALARPRLYANIGIAISDSAITMFAARTASFHVCHRHVRSRPIALEQMAVDSEFAGLVKNLVMVDDRHECVDVPDRIAIAISQMRNLKSVRWVSSAKTASLPNLGRNPHQLPAEIRHIFSRFDRSAPGLEKWSLEYPIQPARPRGEPDTPIVRIPTHITSLEIKNAPNQEALMDLGRYLRSPEGRKIKSLTIEGSSTWKQAIKRATLSLVLPYNEDQPDDQLELETLDLRRLLFGNSTLEKIPFHSINRQSLKNLRFGKCNNYGRILDNCFVDDQTPFNLESLHLTGYYDTCYRFWQMAPAVKTLSLAVEADRERLTGSNIMQYLHRVGDQIERLSLVFLRPNGTVVSSDAPTPDHELVEEEFLRAVAPRCTNVKELALHMTFRSATEKLDTVCDIISNFPTVTAFMISTRSENDLSPSSVHNSEPELYMGSVEHHRAQLFVNAHAKRNGPTLRYVRVDDAFFKIHHGAYDNDFWEPTHSDPVLTSLSRDDIDEGCIPRVMLLNEVEGEPDAWAIGCLENDDDDLNCC